MENHPLAVEPPSWKIWVKLDHKGENQKYLKPPARSICIFDNSTPRPIVNFCILCLFLCNPINGWTFYISYNRFLQTQKPNRKFQSNNTIGVTILHSSTFLVPLPNAVTFAAPQETRPYHGMINHHFLWIEPPLLINLTSNILTLNVLHLRVWLGFATPVLLKLCLPRLSWRLREEKNMLAWYFHHIWPCAGDSVILYYPKLWSDVVWTKTAHTITPNQKHCPSTVELKIRITYPTLNCRILNFGHLHALPCMRSFGCSPTFYLARAYRHGRLIQQKHLITQPKKMTFRLGVAPIYKSFARICQCSQAASIRRCHKHCS